jgi:predicted aspartyl protease
LDDYRAYTFRVPKDHRHAIVIDIKIAIPAPFAGVPPGKKMIDTKALVDTGASGSCISERLAAAAKLVSFTRTNARTAKGPSIVPVYHLDVLMPNKVMFPNMSICEFCEGDDFDFIIGMDILTSGDMAITNANNETVFSFRIPPDMAHIDFQNPVK